MSFTDAEHGAIENHVNSIVEGVRRIANAPDTDIKAYRELMGILYRTDSEVWMLVSDEMPLSEQAQLDERIVI